MTTVNETLHKEIQYLIDELSDPERDDAGVELLTESIFAILPETTSVSLSEYLRLKKSWETSTDLKQDLRDGLADVLLRYTEELSEATLQELTHACFSGDVDEEYAQDCLDTLDLLTDDSGVSAPWFVALSFEQYLDFRGFDDILAENETYLDLVERFDAFHATDTTTNHLDDADYQVIIPAPESKIARAKGLLSSFLKTGKKSA